MKILERGRCRQRGAAAVEFAFVALLVLIPMAMVISQLGWALSEYNTLTKSVRDATRYLTLNQPGTRTEAARCLVKYGNVQVDSAGNATCLGSLLLPNLATATITICEATTCPATHANVLVPGVGRMNLVTVTVSDYSYVVWSQSFVAGVADIPFSPISNTMRAPL